MILMGALCEPLAGLTPGAIGFEDRESLLAHLQSRKMIAEMYSGRHFLSIQQAPEQGDLANSHLLPATENPADGLPTEQSEMVPLLRISESGRFCPRSLRPPKGVPSKEGWDRA